MSRDQWSKASVSACRFQLGRLGYFCIDPDVKAGSAVSEPHLHPEGGEYGGCEGRMHE